MNNADELTGCLVRPIGQMTVRFTKCENGNHKTQEIEIEAKDFIKVMMSAK